MNYQQIIDIRFLAPVGGMILFLYLLSPIEFNNMFGSLNWILGTIGILSLGFIISSITDFFLIYLCKKGLNKYPYNLEKIFGLKIPLKEKDKYIARELATWIVYEKNSSGTNEIIYSQISKRWNIAMANYNFAVSILLAWVGFLSIPNYFRCDLLIYKIIFSILLAGVFYLNGERARKSVLKMDDLLADRNNINNLP